jgi:hypothetical protein
VAVAAERAAATAAAAAAVLTVRTTALPSGFEEACRCRHLSLRRAATPAPVVVVVLEVLLPLQQRQGQTLCRQACWGLAGSVLCGAPAALLLSLATITATVAAAAAVGEIGWP